MARFNLKLGKRIQSEAMKATAADSLSDCISTSAVLIGVFIAMATGKIWTAGLARWLLCLYVLPDSARRRIRFSPCLGRRRTRSL